MWICIISGARPVSQAYIQTLMNRYIGMLLDTTKLFILIPSLSDLDLYSRSLGWEKVQTYAVTMWHEAVTWHEATNLFQWLIMWRRWLQRSHLSMANVDHLNICTSCSCVLWSMTVCIVFQSCMEKSLLLKRRCLLMGEYLRWIIFCPSPVFLPPPPLPPTKDAMLRRVQIIWSGKGKYLVDVSWVMMT